MGRRREVNRGDGRLLLPRHVGQRERDLWPEYANRTSMHICLSNDERSDY